LRLLVDEMYPPSIAVQLRRRGFDVSAVTERPELRSKPDEVIFTVAQDEGRAVVTENIADYVRLAAAAEQRGRPHFGLVLVDPAKFPRGDSRSPGRMVRELTKVLTDHGSDDPRSLRHWL
jgi:hypothetical protein